MKGFMDNEIFLYPYYDPKKECARQAAQIRVMIMETLTGALSSVWIRKAEFISLY